MNPDKWFDYLDGKLPDWERSELEEKITSDPQLQRELAMARRIHSSMSSGKSREVLAEDDPAIAARGRKVALRVGAAFLILMALNVGFGLWFIAHKESSNPNRKLLDEQMRLQFQESAQRAAASLTPPPLDVSDISISTAAGQMNRIADQIVATAEKLGGSATKQLPDANRLGVLVDLPGSRETEFRAALVALGAAPAAPAGPVTNDPKSFVVQIVETP